MKTHSRHTERERAVAGSKSNVGRRRWRAPALISIVLVGVCLGAVKAAPARERRAGTPQQHVTERVVRVIEQSPRIGTTGTRVTLRVHQMPAITPVQVVIGATRSGFEGLAIAQTDIDGELFATVEVPAWSRHDQPHRFIVFNLYFSTVLAESDIFHVTDADGRVLRRGQIGSAGVDCKTLEGDDGERYRLIGATDELGTGDEFEVEGVLRESEEGCGEDVSLEIVLDSTR